MSPAEISLRQEEASFYGAPANEAGDDNIWGLLSGVMGNIYEWLVIYFVCLFVRLFVCVCHSPPP